MNGNNKATLLPFVRSPTPGMLSSAPGGSAQVLDTMREISEHDSRLDRLEKNQLMLFRENEQLRQQNQMLEKVLRAEITSRLKAEQKLAAKTGTGGQQSNDAQSLVADALARLNTPTTGDKDVTTPGNRQPQSAVRGVRAVRAAHAVRHEADNNGEGGAAAQSPKPASNPTAPVEAAGVGADGATTDGSAIADICLQIEATKDSVLNLEPLIDKVAELQQQIEDLRVFHGMQSRKVNEQEKTLRQELEDLRALHNETAATLRSTITAKSTMYVFTSFSTTLRCVNSSPCGLSSVFETVVCRLKTEIRAAMEAQTALRAELQKMVCDRETGLTMHIEAEVAARKKGVEHCNELIEALDVRFETAKLAKQL